MKKEVKFLTASSLFVLLFLMVSGAFDGIMHILVYILGFVAPVFACLYMYYGKEHGDKIFTAEYLKISRGGVVMTLALMPCAVLLTLLSSLSVTEFFALFGLESNVVIKEPPLLALLLHAALPAVLEEAAFRYLPLRIMGGRAPRATVLVSATLFALLHHSFYSIPYAFVAGVVLMCVALITGSVVSSAVIHFANNALALLTMGALGVSAEPLTVIIVLAVLTLLSLALIIPRGRSILSALCESFSVKEGGGSPAVLLYLAVPSLIIAIFEIWG